MQAWWLHPLLVATFPVVHLYAANLGEQITLDPLYLPLAAAIGGAAALLGLLAGGANLLGRDVRKAALLVSLVVALFFAYGHIWQAAQELLRMHRYLLTVWGLVALAGIVLVLRSPAAHVHTATGVLNVIGLILVAVNLVPILQFVVDPAVGHNESVGPRTPASAPPSAGQGRDIWYLVFDRYAGQDALSRIYGYDNSQFLAQLERRGFTIAEHSTANYVKTAHSLASTLGMEYLDAEALEAAASAPDDWKPLYRALQGSHAVQRFVHERGYRYLHLGVLRGATYTNSEADAVYVYGNQTEFGAVLSNTTLLVALENVLGGPGADSYATLYGRHSLYQFSTLAQLASAPAESPRFIFAHFLLPHPPYAFNADGSWVSPEQAAERDEAEEYIQQLQFTNDRMLELLDEVLDRPDDESPIVLIQADEGPFPPRYARDEEGFAWIEATEDELVQKFSILAAYRVPGVSEAELGVYPGITPVNSFRVIFNAAFGTDLPMLPDRNFVFVDQRHIYDMIDVTARLGVLR